MKETKTECNGATEKVEMNREKKTAENSTERELLLTSILNDSNQMVQISDLETYTMLYANEPARIYTGHADQPYQGQHCYQYMMGLEEQCRSARCGR